jgi:peptidoglycan hydrolase-like protein with peptidoglycan-binding domain
MSLPKLSAVLTSLTLIAGWGCAQAQSKPTTAEQNAKEAAGLSVKPSAGPPRANVTGFAQALRCMDTQFRTFGVKNVSVIIEDIPDQTKKVNVGGREMFVSATSQMTRSSRAIRLIPYDGNRRVFQDLFKGQDDIASKAAFAIQGSISQFDESLLKKQRDGGICLGVLCIGGADSDSFSGMSVDMSVLNVRDDLTLVPGAISKNFVLIRKSGKGADADLNYKKFGINFNFVASQSDGQGQALRNLVELSAIELFGRLMKIPYWSCLGVPNTDEGVAAEIEDWWDMLQSDVPSLVSYLQIQMQARGLYKGEIDGIIADELERAVRAYKVAMGQKDDLTLDLDFFRAYLLSNHTDLQPKAQAKLKAINEAEGPIVAAAPAPTAPPPAAAPAATPAPTQVAAAQPATKAQTPAAPAAAAARAALAVQGTKGPQYTYKRGESLDVEVAVNGNGFLYCFLIDDNKTVSQFFPNPVQPAAAVSAGSRLLFPGRFPFQLLASTKGVTETVACFNSTKDLGSSVTLPASVRDLNGLQQAMAQRSGAGTEVGAFDVKVK